MEIETLRLIVRMAGIKVPKSIRKVRQIGEFLKEGIPYVHLEVFLLRYGSLGKPLTYAALSMIFRSSETYMTSIISKVKRMIEKRGRIYKHRHQKPEQWPISVLPIEVDAVLSLRRMQIRSLSDLAQKTKSELVRGGLNPRFVSVIDENLQDVGIRRHYSRN